MKLPTTHTLLSFQLLGAILLTGCSSGQTGKNAAVIGGSALGAAIGHEASDGNVAWTVGGAAAGALTAISANAIADNNERLAYRNGYEAALNQAAKQQYWIIQNRQKEDQFSDQSGTETFIPVVIPEQEINGEIQNERIIYVRAR